MPWFRLALFFLLALAAPASAAEPGYFRVTGVASGDVLNIRAEPRADAEAYGELAPGAGPVEILEVKTEGASEWGRLVTGESDGWVAMRFLEPAEVATIGETAIPDGLSCGGSEPFWNIAFGQSAGMKFSTMEGLELTMPYTFAQTALARMHRFALRGEASGHVATAILGKNETCFDSMADGTRGWRIDLLIEKQGDSEYPQLYEGCCLLPLPR